MSSSDSSDCSNSDSENITTKKQPRNKKHKMIKINKYRKIWIPSEEWENMKITFLFI